MGSWIGDAVAYERRGRATGLIELTWGGAALLGLPLIGYMIGWLPWWSAFALCGVVALVLGIGVSRSEPPRTDHDSTADRKPRMNRELALR